MTAHEFALSDLAARLAGTDASLSTSLRDILAAALQELIEAELTATIGAAPGERTPERIGAAQRAPPEAVVDPGRRCRDRDPEAASRAASSRSCSSRAAGSTRRCGR